MDDGAGTGDSSGDEGSAMDDGGGAEAGEDGAGDGDDGAPSTTGDDDGAGPSDDDGSNDTGGSSSDGGPTGESDDSGGQEQPSIPTDGAALLPWLEAGTYLEFDAESGVHPSAGPHGGGVRTFVNAPLLDSLAAGNETHPLGSGTVKELYSGEAIIGWAVGVKIAEGSGDDTWYWYEWLNDSVIADGVGVGLCANCHSDGVDYVLTPYPLQ